MKKIILGIIVCVIVLGSSTQALSIEQWNYSSKSSKVRTVNKTLGVVMMIGGGLLVADGARTRIKEWDELASKYWYNWDTGESYYKSYDCSDYDSLDYIWSKTWEEDSTYYDYTYYHLKKEYSETWEFIAGLAIAYIGYRIYTGEISPIRVSVNPQDVRICYLAEF